MKKILTLFLVACIVSCSKDDPTPSLDPYLSEVKINGELYSKSFYSSENLIDSIEYYNSDGSRYRVDKWYYDETNNLVAETIYRMEFNELVNDNSIEYEYNAKGLLAKRIDVKRGYVDIFNYTNGKCTSRDFSHDNIEVFHTTYYSYDASDNIIEEERRFSDYVIENETGGGLEYIDEKQYSEGLNPWYLVYGRYLPGYPVSPNKELSKTRTGTWIPDDPDANFVESTEFNFRLNDESLVVEEVINENRTIEYSYIFR